MLKSLKHDYVMIFSRVKQTRTLVKDSKLKMVEFYVEILCFVLLFHCVECTTFKIKFLF